MKKQMIFLISGLLGASLLIGGVVLLLTNHYKDNRQKKIDEEKIIQSEIKSEYNIFKEKMETFSDKRVTIYEELSEDTSYYASIQENYEEINALIKEYESLVKGIEDISLSLKTNCVGKTHTKYDITNKCDAFIKGYEQAINSYVRDVEVMNNRIEEYNDWILEEGNEDYKELSLIVSKWYTEYIDINSDNEYEGKNGD